MQINGGLLKENFRGIPSGMNAAFLYKLNSTVYFFRGFDYWAYDLRAAIRGYPRSVTDFENIPPNVDAIPSDSITYFVVLFTQDLMTIHSKLGKSLNFKYKM
jgi:hypothetical protein